MGFEDGELYKQLHQIEARLSAHSTSECLLWCFENRAHLKKTSSPLEFYLRRQTYVEMARKRELAQAIQYAKKFFPPWFEAHKRDIEKCMALLAISPATRTQPYMVQKQCAHAYLKRALSLCMIIRDGRISSVSSVKSTYTFTAFP